MKKAIFALLLVLAGIGAYWLTPDKAVTAQKATTSFSVAANENRWLTIGQVQFSIQDMAVRQAWEIDLTTKWGDKGVFRGVLLKELLADAGITDFERLFLEANNDYKVTMKANEEGFDTALVAYALDGQLFDPLDKGPFWLIFPSQNAEVLTGEDSGTLWIWGLSQIRKAR